MKRHRRDTTRKAGIDDAVDVARNALQWDIRIGLLMRLLIGGLALVAGALAVVYAYDRADEMVAILQASEGDLGDRLLTLVMPAALLAALGLIGGATALAIRNSERLPALSARVSAARLLPAAASR